MRNQKRVKTPTVFQMEATECGAASLAMVLEYHGCSIPLEQLRVDTGVTRDGCNAKNILVGSKKYGFEAHGYRKEPEDLRSIPMPCILHWNFNHFVVLEGFRGKNVYINDPASGRRKLTLQDLDECFTGVVLTFKITEAFQRKKGTNSLLRKMKDQLQTQRTPLSGLLLLGLILIVPGLILPVLSQVFIDNVLVQGKTDWTMSIVLLMLATLLFQLVIVYYQGFIQTKLKLKLSMVSSYHLLNHLLRLPISYYSQRSLGDLINRNSNNENVNDFLTGDLAQAMLNVFVAAFYLLLLMKYSPLLTLVSLFGVVINLVLTQFSKRIIAPLMQKQQVDEGKMTGYVYSGISISESLKAAGVENNYVARILGQQAKCAANLQKSAILQSYLNSFSTIVDEIFEIVVLVIGVYLISERRMTIGMLVAFTSLVGSLISPINTLIGFTQKSSETKADLGRVEDVLKHPLDPAFLEKQSTVSIDEKLDGNVLLSQISFGHSPLKKPFIEGFDLQVNSGQSVALVGPSGSGKTTIGRIISGLIYPWEGELLFDGYNYKQLPPEVQHASIATVSQNITLFTGTVRENLTMWNENILQEDVIRAAKDACIHDVITSKPGAYDYMLNEDGSNLSGGERQRLEIARALTTNPSVLILDEATSALDPITEQTIMKNLRLRGCSCIIVAHRLSTIRDCSEIVVLENGRIVQRGSHDDLIQQDGLYYQLVGSM